jgi:hypothetical protein
VQGRFTAHRAGKADERLFLWCEHVFEEWQTRRLLT